MPTATRTLKRLRSFDENDYGYPQVKPRSQYRSTTDAGESQHSEDDQASNELGSSPPASIDPKSDDDTDNADGDIQMVDADTDVDHAIEISETEELCFGTISDANAVFFNGEASSQQDPSHLLTGSDTPRRFPVVSRQDYYALESAAENGLVILDAATTRALQALADISSLRLQAVLDGEEPNCPGHQRGKGKDSIMPVSINIYGGKEVMQEVGKRLAKVHIYLQHPIYLDKVQYSNPHYFVLPGTDQEHDSYLPPPGQGVRKSEVVDIDRLFEELDHTQGLHIWNADSQIRTPLLEHQKKALYFLHQKESGIAGSTFSLWKAHKAGHRQYYQHVILGSRVAEVTNLPRGGILADDMGLGKTLTMISAIVMSLSEGAAFARAEQCPQGGCSDGAHRRVKSSLVIVPSSVLLDGWIEEITRHVAPESLKVYRYHGPGKFAEIDSIVDYDVVVTTYATIASEVAKGSSLLHELMWFRIVLDEAHMIRHQSTKQFRAISSLHADRRWCLTGTPIQNRLEDLGSLIRFLRVAPFDSNRGFRHHISEPLLTQAETGDLNLRLLLGSVCLRRTRVLLDLPDAKEETFVSSLSAEEKALYAEIIEDSRRAIDYSISNKSIAKAYNGILQAILRLRVLCNNGPQQPLNSISDAHFDSTGAAGTLENSKMACAFCSCEMLVSDALGNTSTGASYGNVSALLCPACLSPNEIRKCKNKGKLNMPETTSIQCLQPASPDEDQSPRYLSKHAENTAPLDSRRSLCGKSSKLSALVSNIEKTAPGNKNLVFSCWKTTLSILERILREANIPYVRIDGAIAISERNRIIKQFQEDGDTNLLLMTTGTGAVGLNLTAATQVHLVEPQWNPAIEAQAIGRAVRLGQTRTVTIIRYVMEKTIEEAIQSRQIIKLQLAELTLEKKEGNEQTMLRRLKDLRSLLHKY